MNTAPAGVYAGTESNYWPNPALEAELEQLAGIELARGTGYVSPLAERDAELQERFKVLEQKVKEEDEKQELKMREICGKARVITKYLLTDSQGVSMGTFDYDYYDERRTHEEKLDIRCKYFIYLHDASCKIEYQGKTVYEKTDRVKTKDDIPERTRYYVPGEWEQELDGLYQEAIAKGDKEFRGN